MLSLAGWEVALLGVAAFVAVTSLVALMNQQRDQLTNELLHQAEDEHRLQQEAERKAKRKKGP